ncbi:hypothetical protein HQ544_03730 [Candidatus Falkowbacteria bacterium]|nr:hypothetical protein [Candidatus Falkowbacteria bacterium]
MDDELIGTITHYFDPSTKARKYLLTDNICFSEAPPAYAEASAGRSALFGPMSRFCDWLGAGRESD